jgi:hypothetical protein
LYFYYSKDEHGKEGEECTHFDDLLPFDEKLYFISGKLFPD